MKTMRRLLHVLSRVLVWLLLRPILFYQRFITPYTPPCAASRRRARSMPVRL